MDKGNIVKIVRKKDLLNDIRDEYYGGNFYNVPDEIFDKYEGQEFEVANVIHRESNESYFPDLVYLKDCGVIEWQSDFLELVSEC